MFVNTHLLNEVARNGLTQAPEGSYEWYEWWNEQRRRCIEGYSVGGLRITGVHYFYLNFWHIRATEEDGTSFRKRLMHPRFRDIDHKFFWAWEEARKSGLDFLYVKRRQVGATDKAACILGHEYSFFPDSYCQIVASRERYSNIAFRRVKLGLDSLAGTEFYKKREGSNSDDDSNLKAQYIETVDGKRVLSGYMSHIQKFVCDGDPQVLVGNTPAIAFFDEVGVFSGWKSVREYILPGMEQEGIRTGICLMVGTGGESGPGIEDLRMVAHNPEPYGIAAFDRPDDEEEEGPAEGVVTSIKKKICFFTPGYEGFKFDKDGNSDIEYGKKKIAEERKKREGDEKRYLEYVTQYPNTLEEALLTPAGSRFNIKKLRDQVIIINKSGGIPIQRGELIWERDEKGVITGISWDQSNFGRYRIVEHPMIEPGKKRAWPSLYVAGTDSYDRDKTASTHGSFGSMHVFKRFLDANHTSNLFVASLHERPETSAEFYEDTAKLAYYYNAMNLVEYSNLLILEWYKQNGFEWMLKERPEVAYSNVMVSRAEYKYGIDPVTKPYWIQSLADYIEKNSHNIWDPQLLEALINYRDDKDYNCDITISSALAITHNNDLIHQMVKRDEVKEKAFRKRHKYVMIGGRLQKVYA